MQEFKKVNVGIIGCGDWARVHARVYSELPNTHIIAVADIDEKKAKEFASKFKIKIFYNDYEKLLKHKDIDVVSICTPETLHVEPAVATAEAGKSLLLEKPIATTLEGADKIIKAAKEASVKAMVNFEYRFVPERAKIKQFAEAKSFGELISVYARRNTRISTARMVAPRMGRGAELLEEDIHDIDQVLWWVNDDVETVYAKAVRKVLRKEIPEAADAWWVMIRFKNRAIGVLESSWIMDDNSWAAWKNPSSWKPDGWVADDTRYEILGSKGAVFFDGFPPSVYACDSEGWKFPEIGTLDNMFGQFTGAIKKSVAHFITCIQNDSPIQGATLEEARSALEVALAAIESEKEGHEVQLPPK